MKRMLVDQKVITNTSIDDVGPIALEPGQARLQLRNFALTANNVTYAATGFAIGYWNFFPSGVTGQGLLPVWGTGEVVESRSDALAVGTRLYGYFPLAEALVITPQATKGGAIRDAAPHRVDLPAVYNMYVPSDEKNTRMEHLRALLQPLLATSWLLADWLDDNGYFGAGQVIVGSASSKTGLGLCRFLADKGDVQVIGLTSAGNHEFVEKSGSCEAVFTYDQVDDLARVPSVYVDMAGNSAVKQQLHATLGDHLKHSAAVGISHWDRFAPQEPVPGIKPEFFFAPAQIAKRREEWGPGVAERKIDAAWRQVADTADGWMDLRVHEGMDAAADIYDALAQGRANPRDGHVVAL